MINKHRENQDPHSRAKNWKNNLIEFAPKNTKHFRSQLFPGKLIFEKKINRKIKK